MGQQKTGHGQEVDQMNINQKKRGRGQSLQAEFYISCQLTVNRTLCIRSMQCIVGVSS